MAQHPRSPLAPPSFPEMPTIAGVTLHPHAAALRYTGRPDLLLIEMPAGTTVGGVFTRSLCPSAPVDWCRQILGGGRARALVCNAGNANAFTGAAGATSVQAQVETLAAALDVPGDQVYVASTGVIGEPLDDEAMTAALRGLAVSEPAAWPDAALAITTTDTFAKGAAASLPGGSVVGVAKGSGMIAPDMATMLAFLCTDVAATADACQLALAEAVGRSFNRITVDSDTSTSDTVLLFATGGSDASRGVGPIDGPDHPGWADFAAGVEAVCLDLAHQIVRDGEGATKFIAVQVDGAVSDDSAERIARSIADSPLVKTAIAAEDANWGRFVMAVGKAGEPADRDRLDLWIGDEPITAGGQAHPEYSEARADRFLQQDEITVRVDLHLGTGSATVWTCDLTHGYIEINAGYRS
ncbi:MAG: bifunctional glutamate N-acetyltransferase/amino-acid acetyltransferase ArgJ [Acidobacteriota bacterium]